MAFGGIIQRVPSFGEEFAQKMGAGLSKGLEKSTDLTQQMILENQKLQKRKSLIDSVRKGDASEIPTIHEKAVSELTPKNEEKPSLINQKTEKEESDEHWEKAEKYAEIKEHDLSRIETERAKSKSKESFQRQQANEAAIERSFKAHEDYIKDTTSAYRAFETETKPRLQQMQALNTSDEELIGPSSARFLEILGLPLGMLENPSNELYSKLSQDLLKGLPETYGNKILRVEVENFLKTIPTLTNSANGRRMIASNFLKLGEMKETFFNEMRDQQLDAIQNNTKLPKDFEQKILENVMPKINKLSNEFLKLSTIKDVPQNTVPFFDPQGNVSFVPKDEEAMKWAEENGGKRIW